MIEAFDALFNRRDYTRAEAFWSPDYIQHSAHIAAGRTGLFDLVRSLPAELRYEHQLVAAHGDHIILHGRFSNHGQPVNWVVADIVRIADGKLAEHWDVIQDEVDEAQSRSGLPMFGDAFPKAPPARPASLLLQAFVEYLRARPTVVDTDSTRDFNGGHAALEGVSSRPSSLGGVPADHPRAARRDSRNAPSCTSTAADTSAVRHRTDTYRWPAPWRSPHRPPCTPSTTDWLLKPASPGAFEDCLAAYRWTVGDGGVDPDTVAVLGDSAGGNLAVAVTVAARDESLPLPSCIAAISPFADLTLSGQSMESRKLAGPLCHSRIAGVHGGRISRRRRPGRSSLLVSLRRSARPAAASDPSG